MIASSEQGRRTKRRVSEMDAQAGATRDSGSNPRFRKPSRDMDHLRTEDCQLAGGHYKADS